MQVIFIPRSEWGATQATEDFIAGRPTVPEEERISVQVHHTAAIDVVGGTPNRWTKERALAYVKRLQTSRPDLGPMPYNFNPAVSEDLQTVWMFEGRGAHKRGAHTANHNRTGIGYGILGNFDNRDDAARDVVIAAIEQHASQLRDDGMSKLTTQLNFRGWKAWGHRDTSTKSCPGNHLYWSLSGFTLEEGGEDMLTKWMDEATFTYLYSLGIVDNSVPLNVVLDFWVTNRHLRTEAEHSSGSNSVLRALAEKGVTLPGGNSLQRGDQVTLA